MSWLKTTSLTFARQLSRSLDPRHDYEPQACYSSFCKHWQQAHEIILKSQPQHLHDDVLGVVNHLEQLATLLVLEARAREVSTVPSSGECLEHLLSENLLDKLYEWGNCTGKYENAVWLEQLKLFGILVSHYGSQVLAAEPFLRPLLKLLNGFRNELTPVNLENQLVSVLNQLCVVLMQNIKFIDLFFLTNHTNENEPKADFIISRLLLTFVHREGGAGAAARDALLLCANMSARCPQLARCMLEGLTCPVLATVSDTCLGCAGRGRPVPLSRLLTFVHREGGAGAADRDALLLWANMCFLKNDRLSGLYSLLPRTLGDNIFRLTPDDVNKVHKLTLFIDSLEFCNAVAQVAHQSIKKNLLDLLYQGFLVPVMGPALLQTKPGPLQSGAPEQAAAMAYLELVLRCSTQRGLLRAVLHFLFTYEYDGVKLIDVMLRRLDGNTQLSLVSLSLMETLIDLNCEDVMLELVYKHLLNGNYLMTSQRHKLTDPESYREAAMSFLSLTPECCFRPLSSTREWTEELALSGRRVLDFKREEERVNGVQENGIAMNSLVQEVKFNYGNPNETLFGNFHAYLCDARFEIVSRSLACSRWSSKYDAVITPKREPNNNTKETRDEPAPTKEQNSLVSICTSGYDTLKTSDTSEKEPHSLTSLNEAENVDNENSDAKDRDSLISMGSDSDKNDEFVEDVFRMCFMKVEEREYDGEPNLIRSWRASAESLVGPLLSSLLKKAAALLESDVLTNCLVTCVVSKLAAAPSALLPALLLPAERTLQPSVPSLYQILSKLKDELDELTSGLDNTPELLDKARVFLIQREMLLVQARAPNTEQPQSNNVGNSPRGEESPLRRGETKRRSLSTSFTNMFGRRLSASPSQPHSIPHAPSPQKRPVFTQEAYWNQSIALRSILNAVILDEWLKELAALCEEHALRLAANYEDDTYLRTVAL